jgi:hypothetical protein
MRFDPRGPTPTGGRDRPDGWSRIGLVAAAGLLAAISSVCLLQPQWVRTVLLSTRAQPAVASGAPPSQFDPSHPPPAVPTMPTMPPSPPPSSDTVSSASTAPSSTAPIVTSPPSNVPLAARGPAATTAGHSLDPMPRVIHTPRPDPTQRLFPTAGAAGMPHRVRRPQTDPEHPPSPSPAGRNKSTAARTVVEHPPSPSTLPSTPSPPSPPSSSPSPPATVASPGTGGAEAATPERPGLVAPVQQDGGSSDSAPAESMPPPEAATLYSAPATANPRPPSWLTEDQVRRYTGSREIARESQTPMGQQILGELFGSQSTPSR